MPRRTARAVARPVVGWLALAAAAPAVAGCGGGTSTLSAAELRDPAQCQGCHPAQFAEWAGSMHAYASDDPVFLAMNRRGQRETNGALGDFCVRCHAPQAVRDGLTTDGMNLPALPASAKGVTCYFCHAAESIEGTHNNPLILGTDGTLFGPFRDPSSGSPHRSAYAALFDETRTESANACGGCHDIVNGHGVALERTFAEWQGTLFAIPPHGLTCAGCHMSGRDGLAATTGTKTRRIHDHGFPAVDVVLSSFPGADRVAQEAAVQTALDTTLQGTICLDDASRRIIVGIDNVGAAHAWPSGASQDRRAWVQVTAWVGDRVVHRSGLEPGETTATAADPDLWVIRDCIYGADGGEVHMFWEATSYLTNALPGPVLPDVRDPTSLVRTHLKKTLPAEPRTLSELPDRITLEVYLKAIGDEVLESLVTSGDLAPSDAAAVPTFRMGGLGPVTWTRATATSYIDGSPDRRLACVSSGTYTPMINITEGKSHAHCPAPPPPAP